MRVFFLLVLGFVLLGELEGSDQGLDSGQVKGHVHGGSHVHGDGKGHSKGHGRRVRKPRIGLHTRGGIKWHPALNADECGKVEAKHEGHIDDACDNLKIDTGEHLCLCMTRDGENWNFVCGDCSTKWIGKFNRLHKKERGRGQKKGTEVQGDATPSGRQRPEKPVRPVKPVIPVKPVKPLRPAKPVKAVRSHVKPLRPVNPVRPGKPVKPARPGKPVKPARPGKSVRPGKPVKPVRPGKPVKPVRPGKPVKPVRPGKPVKPARPGKPVKPVRPEKPVIPGKPGRPGRPGRPDRPGRPGRGRNGNRDIPEELDNREKYRQSRLPQRNRLNRGRGQHSRPYYHGPGQTGLQKPSESENHRYGSRRYQGHRAAYR